MPRKKAYKKKENIRYVTSQVAVAREFEVDASTVRRDWKAKDMPVEPDGTYDLVAIAAWRGLMKPARGKDKEDETDGPAIRRKTVELRIKEAELASRERANNLAVGMYVLREDVERLFALIFSRFRDELTCIPGEMKASFPKSVRSDLVSQMKKRLDLVLRTIHRQRRKIEEVEAVTEKKKQGRPKKGM